MLLSSFLRKNLAKSTVWSLRRKNPNKTCKWRALFRWSRIKDRNFMVTSFRICCKIEEDCFRAWQGQLQLRRPSGGRQFRCGIYQLHWRELPSHRSRVPFRHKRPSHCQWWWHIEHSARPWSSQCFSRRPLHNRTRRAIIYHHQLHYPCLTIRFLQYRHFWHYSLYSRHSRQKHHCKR